MIDETGYDRALAEARVTLEGGAGIDTVLAGLRAAGFSPVDSIRAVHALTGVSLAEAKETVHSSPVWAGERARNDDFHRSLEQGLAD